MAEKDRIKQHYWPYRKNCKYTPEVIEELAANLMEWVETHAQKKKNFLIRDWCFEVGIRPDYLTRFADSNIEFEEAYKWAKEWQAHMIYKGALHKRLSEKMATWQLVNQHGWTPPEVYEGRDKNVSSPLQQIADILNENHQAIPQADPGLQEQQEPDKHL